MQIASVSHNPKESNWFFKKYFRDGANFRYWTFQLALNLLNQRFNNPVIIETGCQREKDDIGAGMSTSIFAEYIYKYGGKLITVDNSTEHLGRARGYILEWKTDVNFIHSDSIKYLKEYKGECSLLYLDSLDYPITTNPKEALAAQEHNLKEFQAIEVEASNYGTILLLDDNYLPGGGKPKLLKEYLEKKNWNCLLEYQQSLWVKG